LSQLWNSVWVNRQGNILAKEYTISKTMKADEKGDWDCGKFGGILDEYM
jgi:hypothetical protein